MKKNRPKALSLLLLFMILFFSGCSNKSTEKEDIMAAEKKETLTVGMYLSYPPFETINSQREAEGLSVALAENLGNYLNLNVEIINIPYDSLVPSIVDGRSDIVISSLPITQERLSLVDFSEPYAQVKYSILLNEDLTIGSLKDLDKSQYTIAVKKDSLGDGYASQKLHKAKIVKYTSDTEAAEAVVNSQADAYIQDELTVFKYWKLYPVATRILFTGEDIAQSWGIAVSKNNPELKNKINEFLASFKAGEGFKELSQLYLPKESDTYKTWNIPFIFD